MEKEKEKEIVRICLTGNGGQAHHDVIEKDACELELLLDTGSNKKTFKFTDQTNNSKVIVVLDKLFIMEVGKKDQK